MRKKLIMILAAIFTAAMLASRIGAAFAAPSFEGIYKKALSINSGMKDCQADLNIKFNVKYILPLRFSLTGKYYYKAPDKFKVDLKRTPSFLKKYPKVFSWALPEVKDFNTAVLPDEAVDGKNCFVLLLTPKQPMGDLANHTIWIDQEEYIMRKQMFKYNTDARITINQYYVKLQGYWVFNNLQAVFNFPKINLNADVNANYENYKFNQNLPDKIFE